MTSVRESNSVEETEAAAAELAGTLRGGECLALHGDLGAGKTQFVRGLVRGLGGNPRAVSSPTFVLLNVYDAGRLTVYHLDAYRVHGAEDFEAIGFAELLEQGGVVVVEWADRVSGLLPADRVEVKIEPRGETRRRIEMTRLGGNADRQSGRGNRQNKRGPTLP
jgi:tRNA threonylcarbamoyladenosine biosynthesis protein TsaE